MSNPPIRDDLSVPMLQGDQGKTLCVVGDTVRIEKQGFLTAKREKTIRIRNITSVDVRKPRAFVVGFIQFSIAGCKARDSSYRLSGGSFDVVQDENSVVFTGQENYEIALRIKAHVENWSGGQSHDPPPLPAAPLSIADEIRKLKALADEGLLTTKEFERKKRQLLATLNRHTQPEGMFQMPSHEGGHSKFRIGAFEDWSGRKATGTVQMKVCYTWRAAQRDQ